MSAAVERTRVIGWPGVNHRVRVGLTQPAGLGGDVLELPTRVEDVLDEALVLAAPDFAGDLHFAVPGLELSLAWATERGSCTQDVTLVEVSRQRVPCWVVEPAGPVLVQQRRRYVRVAVTGGARLREVTSGAGAGQPPAAPGVADATLVDLSEGGVHLRTAPVPWLVPGRSVRAVFEIGDGPVDVLADVLAVRLPTGLAPVGPSDASVAVALEFVEPVACADRLRAYVMQMQILNRRRGV